MKFGNDDNILYELNMSHTKGYVEWDRNDVVEND
jgi:hypothetical protein